MTRRDEIRGILSGIFFLLGAHFVAFWIYWGLLFAISLINQAIPNSVLNSLITNYVWVFPILFLGVSQLVYVIPIALWLKRHGQSARLKGVIMGAVLTALLNGGCFLLLSLQR